MASPSGISDKTFALLIAITLVFSFGASFYILQESGIRTGKITGYALMSNASATLVIQTTSSIRFSQASLNFGTGSVNTSGGFRNCSLTTVSGAAWANSGCSDFSELENGFTIENDGNTNLTVTLRSNATAAQFIGSAGAMFRWNVSLNESGSCLNVSNGQDNVVSPNTSLECGTDGPAATDCGSIFESVTTTAKTICPRLRYVDQSDSLNIDVNVTIPDDATAGTKLAGFIVTGTRDPLV